MLSIFALVSAGAPPYQESLAPAPKDAELFGGESALEVNGSKLGSAPAGTPRTFVLRPRAVLPGSPTTADVVRQVAAANALRPGALPLEGSKRSQVVEAALLRDVIRVTLLLPDPELQLAMNGSVDPSAPAGIPRKPVHDGPP